MKRSYKEGNNIYSEPYANWLLENHPKETPTDWITRLNEIEKGIFKWQNLIKNFDTYVHIFIMGVDSGVSKSKCFKNSSVHSNTSMVPQGSQQSNITEGDANEQLYQKWFEERYDIYDDEYAKEIAIK